ncbi:MAG: nucleotidyl transferase AbiEii/AbiGii toxin family protein [Solirubrobacteraceae bacterium]
MTPATYDVALTQGHVLRHAPAQSSQGRGAALIDIAQDLLLRYLSEQGVLMLVAFKGGTALRKVYAGAAGRFSTDLDFAVASLDDDPDAVIQLFVDEIDGTQLGPFTFGIETRRNRHTITYRSELGPDPGQQLQSKLDVGPPPWLEPVIRSWVEVPIHARYGGPLPSLPVVSLAENVAEKIARLNRRSPARDAYDLVWLAGTPGLDLDRALIRRLVVLKSWVDLHGLHTENARWAAPLPGARPFDAERWLSPRIAADFDDEVIGLLTVPPPDLNDLGKDLSRLHQWIAELDDDEQQVAEGRQQDRGLVLSMIANLPGGRMAGAR